MKAVKGTAGLKGIAIGPLYLYRRQRYDGASASLLGIEEELSRFEAARRRAGEQLEVLSQSAEEKVGRDTASIFDIHRMLLDDEDLLEAVREVIRDRETTAEYAVDTAGQYFAAILSATEDPYLQARSADVLDVAHRMVGILRGVEPARPELDEPSILVADDITPSETVQLDRSKVLGFITRRGSPNSHAAILARSMNIPALTGVEFEEDWNGRLAVLDGECRMVYLDPDPDLLAAMSARQREDQTRQAMLLTLKGKPNRTLDGREIQVCANIGDAEDVERVLWNDAQGVGLFRSEFLYLEKGGLPTEEEQLAAYQRVVQAMEGKRVVIRTMDIGSDKKIQEFGMEREINPALGCRGIRLCLTHPEVCKQQLRAILRASALGKVAVMFPMVADLREVRQAKALLEECRTELAAQKLPMGQLEVGVMIETPAAVVMADELAQEVDFFSIGTNDLTQYTLAVDRQDPKLAALCDPHHPAVLRMIRHTIQAGHRHGCWVGICGELGADPSMTETFLRMGVDELSVAPSAVLPLRQSIRELDLSGAE